MVSQISDVPVALVEVFDEILLARPHEYIMLCFAKMVCETRSKVPGAEDKNAASRSGRVRGREAQRRLHDGARNKGSASK